MTGNCHLIGGATRAPIQAATHPHPGLTSTRSGVPRALQDVRNCASSANPRVPVRAPTFHRADSIDSGIGDMEVKKQGTLVVPKVGDDVAKVVLRHAATRILDGKEPMPVVFANEAELHTFLRAVADFRSQLAALLANTDGIDAPTLEKTRALYEASQPGRLMATSNTASGALSRLDATRDKLYVLGHGSAGADGIWYTRGKSDVLFRHADIARQLVGAGVPRDFSDFRLLSCESASVPARGGPTSGERLLHALTAEGFERAEVSAYPGVIDLLTTPLQDGKFHRQVLVGEEETPVQASTVRQVYRDADVDGDYMNLDDWRQQRAQAEPMPMPMPKPPLPHRAYRDVAQPAASRLAPRGPATPVDRDLSAHDAPPPKTPKALADAVIDLAKRENRKFSHFKGSSLDSVLHAIRKGEDIGRVIGKFDRLPPDKQARYAAVRSLLVEQRNSVEAARR